MLSMINLSLPKRLLIAFSVLIVGISLNRVLALDIGIAGWAKVFLMAYFVIHSVLLALFFIVPEGKFKPSKNFREYLGISFIIAAISALSFVFV
ncbi:MAG: hypothetical protein KFH87_01715 [Bacteroidetes bacterium]|nr:hypothetical protein [Bacteroidota bacterium]